ncbi:MAG TPA: hypothetical protein VNA04_08505 [Thermoanaerobaculia bacterium]|nr:hypothetical protein [Thermoanaerobaculia bacterium]
MRTILPIVFLAVPLLGQTPGAVPCPGTGDIDIEVTSVIRKGGSRFLHTHADPASDGQNLFLGVNAGNFMMGPAGGLSYLSSGNTGIGYGSLAANTTGFWNTAIGREALPNNTTGNNNTVVGSHAMFLNTTGRANTAVGIDVLYHNTAGLGNSGYGLDSLNNTTTGHLNSAYGLASHQGNTTGANNTSLGAYAGAGDNTINQRSSVDNSMTFVGYRASRDGSVPQATPLSNSTAIGAGAKVDANDKIVLGNDAVSTFQLGSSSPTAPAKTLRAASTIGSNRAGGDLIIQPGNGTGSGGSGDILFQTAPAAGSGSTPNVMATALTIDKSGNVGIGGQLDFITGSATPTTAAQIAGWQAGAAEDAALLVFRTKASGGVLQERMRISSSGVSIGSGGTPIAKHLSATATWDPPPVANGAATATSVTVAGAVAGDSCFAGFSVLPDANWIISAHATAANTVRVVLANHTGGIVDLGSGTVRASCWQY